MRVRTNGGTNGRKRKAIILNTYEFLVDDVNAAPDYRTRIFAKGAIKEMILTGNTPVYDKLKAYAKKGGSLTASMVSQNLNILKEHPQVAEALKFLVETYINISMEERNMAADNDD